MKVPRRSVLGGLAATVGAKDAASATGHDNQEPGDVVEVRIVKSVRQPGGQTSGAKNGAWTKGYTQSELDRAQEEYGLVFPPDLVALLRDRRPVQGVDWRKDGEQIRALLKWPFDGLLFDVENNALWWPEWGIRPERMPERAAVLEAVISKAPKLIPLGSHRYLPTDPNEAGNPVFSIYQSDVIYYGADLLDYFEREFGDSREPVPTSVRRIRFWSDLVERNGMGQG